MVFFGKEWRTGVRDSCGKTIGNSGEQRRGIYWFIEKRGRGGVEKALKNKKLTGANWEFQVQVLFLG